MKKFVLIVFLFFIFPLCLYAGAQGDGLGNHKARKDLNMAFNSLNNCYIVYVGTLTGLSGSGYIAVPKSLYLIENSSICFNAACHATMFYDPVLFGIGFSSNVILNYGGDLYVYDTDNSDYGRLYHSGSTFYVGAIGNLWLTSSVGAIGIGVYGTQHKLSVYSSPMTQRITFFHDGTDKNGVIQVNYGGLQLDVTSNVIISFKTGGVSKGATFYVNGDLRIDATSYAYTGNFEEIIVSTIHGKSPININSPEVNIAGGALNILNGDSQNAGNYIRINEKDKLALAVSSAPDKSPPSNDPADARYSFAVSSHGHCHAKYFYGDGSNLENVAGSGNKHRDYEIPASEFYTMGFANTCSIDVSNQKQYTYDNVISSIGIYTIKHPDTSDNNFADCQLAMTWQWDDSAPTAYYNFCTTTTVAAGSTWLNLGVSTAPHVASSWSIFQSTTNVPSAYYDDFRYAEFSLSGTGIADGTPFFIKIGRKIGDSCITDIHGVSLIIAHDVD